jgi:hypothetical protein
MTCPYCNAADSCEHHLLSVDRSERRACGGELYEPFNARLSAALSRMQQSEAEDPESEALAACIEEVEKLVSSQGREVGGALSSGEFEDFFCSTPERVQFVVSDYMARFGRVKRN